MFAPSAATSMTRPRATRITASRPAPPSTNCPKTGSAPSAALPNPSSIPRRRFQAFPFGALFAPSESRRFSALPVKGRTVLPFFTSRRYHAACSSETRHSLGGRSRFQSAQLPPLQPFSRRQYLQCLSDSGRKKRSGGYRQPPLF